MQLTDILNNLSEVVACNEEKVVAVEINNSGSAEVFFRNNEIVSSEIREFTPFILLTSSALLNKVQINCKIKNLTPALSSGKKNYCALALFQNSDEYKLCLKHLKKETGYTPSAPGAPYKIFSDLNSQFMILSGIRLFRGMTFSQLRRFQFDIETLTTEGYEFPNPKREDDAVCMISMSDNSGWEQCLQLNKPYSEKELLEEFVNIIKLRNPDIIEGHNLFNFDFSYIEERAKLHKIKLKLGRNDSILKSRPSRFNIAEKTVTYKKYEIYGRHIIDTYHLVQHYDVIHRNLESFGLKSVAVHFGVAASDRTYVEGKDITHIFKTDPDRLLKYALDDVRETASIAEILAPSYFYMIQLIPLSYQNSVIRGNATKIDLMLISEYIRQGYSIPYPSLPQSITGALTGAPSTGVFSNVWHCDIRSLYPSIIISEKLVPQSDRLAVFSKYLSKLRTFRLMAKDAQKLATDKDEKQEYNALQTSFKILINSFYGYLGFAMGAFNDYQMADKVTTRGRELLNLMLDFLKSVNALIIEMDTDGIYFQPPESMNLTPTEMEKQFQNILPEGIEVELDSVYPAMFCYKSKNYALLSNEGEVIITGAALKSRGIEPFQRDYMKELLHLLMLKKYSDIEKLTEKYRAIISDRKIPLKKLAKTVTLKEKPENYRKKLQAGKTRRNAAYELALNSPGKYTQGDQISYIVTGNSKKVSVVDNAILLTPEIKHGIENTTYYLGKLDDLYKKFSNFISTPSDQTEFDF
jgi:DNA polymerase elongation subunit (family B)